MRLDVPRTPTRQTIDLPDRLVEDAGEQADAIAEGRLDIMSEALNVPIVGFRRRLVHDRRTSGVGRRRLSARRAAQARPALVEGQAT